jgi:hypothetical protein
MAHRREGGLRHRHHVTSSHCGPGGAAKRLLLRLCACTSWRPRGCSSSTVSTIVSAYRHRALLILQRTSGLYPTSGDERQTNRMLGRSGLLVSRIDLPTPPFFFADA